MTQFTSRANRVPQLDLQDQSVDPIPVAIVGEMVGQFMSQKGMRLVYDKTVENLQTTSAAVNIFAKTLEEEFGIPPSEFDRYVLEVWPVGFDSTSDTVAGDDVTYRLDSAASDEPAQVFPNIGSPNSDHWIVSMGSLWLNLLADSSNWSAAETFSVFTHVRLWEFDELIAKGLFLP